MKIFKELNKLGYKYYTEHTVEELDDLPLDSEERIMEQALVLKWFRDKYGIFTSIVPNKYGSLDSFIGWIYVPSNGTTKDINVGDRKGFSTPEEAELACLKKLIQIVKDGK